jgi:hypothetical protein
MDPEQEQTYLKRIDEQHRSLEDIKGNSFWSFLSMMNIDIRFILESKPYFMYSVVDISKHY